MWYEVPQEKPKPEAPPPAIFPWERQENRPRPTRKFIEDQPPQAPKPKEKTKPSGLQMPPAIAVGDDIFTPFSPQANAWDENPSIERYVRAVFESQNPHRARHAPTQSQEILSPSGRRESLILTDFPTADDRPSLPVTPAPIRRPTFWGEERDEAGELPAAEGVPDQAEWVCPQCGFSSDAPVAFLRARSASAALAAQAVVEEHLVSPTGAPVLPVEESGVSVAAAAAAQPARLPSPPQPTPPPAPARNAWDDIPLPAHLRPRPKTRHSSSDFSSASTAVGPSVSATAGPEDLPKLSSDVPSPIAELRAAETESAEGEIEAGDEEAVVSASDDGVEMPLSATPALASGEVTPKASTEPFKEILPPPAWLTGPIQQQG